MTRPQSWKRLVLPACLAAVGVWLLAGCIYIPTFGTVTAGKNVAGKVGDEASRKPLRVGHATREDVIALLGHPHVTKSDRSAVAYTWNVRNAFVVWPLCFQGYPLNGRRSLVLRFGPDDRLAGYEVLKDDDELVDFSSPGGPPLPEDLEHEQYRQTNPNSRHTTP